MGIFGSKYGYWTPCGGLTERHSLLFGDSFWRYTIILCCKWHDVASLHHLMVKIWELLSKHHYFGSFFIKIGEFDPRGVHKCGRSVLVLDSFYPYTVVFEFVWNGFLCMFDIFQGVKSVKNCIFSLFFDKILPFNPPWCSEKGLPSGLFVLF